MLEKAKKNRANIRSNGGEINEFAEKTPFFKGVMAIIYNFYEIRRTLLCLRMNLRSNMHHPQAPHQCFSEIKGL